MKPELLLFFALFSSDFILLLIHISYVMCSIDFIIGKLAEELNVKIYIIKYYI